jgi:hypothetical protein
MGVRQTCDTKMSLLWYLFLMMSLLSAQELDHMNKDTVIDFEGSKMLADLEPEANNSFTTEDSPSTPDDLNTPNFTNSFIGTSEKNSAARDEVTLKQADVVDSREKGVMWGRDSTVGEDKGALQSTVSSQTTVDIRFNEVNNVLLETPPNIRWPLSQNMLTFKVNTATIYQCMASGNPTPTFQWLRNGAPIINTEYIHAYDNGTLVFRSASHREDGIFQCKATNKLGTSVSVTVPILCEREPRKIDFLNLTRHDVKKEGDTIAFGCDNPHPGVPAYTKRWIFTAGTQPLPVNKRFGSDTKGVLRFAYLEKNDSNSYMCVLAPEVAMAHGTIKFFNIAVLTVQEHAKTNSSANLASASGNVKAVLGETATIECFFYGNPVPNITWRRESSRQEITRGDKYMLPEDHFNRRLVIRNVQAEDADTYTCVGNNGYGGMAVGTTVLNVTSPPMKIPYQGLDRIVKADGGDQVLKCKADVLDKQIMNAPEWYRNGEPLNENNLPYPERYIFNEDMTELTIRQLDKTKDTACFQCNISNSEGYLFYDGYLTVINSIKINKKPSDFVINNANVVDISIIASGDDCCTIAKRWYLNEEPLSAKVLREPPYEFRNEGDYFIFNASSVTREELESRVGNYRCLLFNDYEALNVTFTITLKGFEPTREPLKAAEAEAGMPLWWIGLVCGILLIIIALVVIIIFVKSNYPGDTYLLEKAEIKHHLNPEQDLLDQSFHEV